MKEERLKIKYSQPCSLGDMSLNGIIEQLYQIKVDLSQKGIDDLWLNIDSGYSNYFTSIEGTRLETDEEYNMRIDTENKTKNKEKESRRKQYEKLRKEFEE